MVVKCTKSMKRDSESQYIDISKLIRLSRLQLGRYSGEQCIEQEEKPVSLWTDGQFCRLQKLQSVLRNNDNGDDHGQLRNVFLQKYTTL